MKNLFQDLPEDLLHYRQEILNQVQDDGEWFISVYRLEEYDSLQRR